MIPEGFKVELLASASNKKRMIECINDFYCGEGFGLKSTKNDKVFEVVNSYGCSASGVQVRKYKGRYRFEMLLPDSEVDKNA